MRTALVLSLTLVLGTAAMAAPEAPVAPSPYSKKAETAKQAKVLSDYAQSRDSLGKSEAIMNMEETESPTNPDDVDGITPPPGPGRKEALRPVDDHARRAQQLLRNDVKNTGTASRSLSRVEFAEEVVGEPGKEDNVDEYAHNKAKNDGRFAPGINPEEFEKYAPQRGTWSAGA